MRPRRAFRRSIATLLAIVMMFAQAAALAYTCQLDEAPSQPLAAPPCPAHLVEDDGASSRADASGNLCKFHCETPTPAEVNPLVVAMAAPISRALTPRIVVVHEFRPRPPEPQGAAPPLILRTSRLLI